MIKKVIDKFPDDGYFLDTLGWIYYKQKKYNQAIRQLERAAKLQSDDVKIKKLVQPTQQTQPAQKKIAKKQNSTIKPIVSSNNKDEWAGF